MNKIKSEEICIISSDRGEIGKGLGVLLKNAYR
jgi:hypothetical protein